MTERDLVRANELAKEIRELEEFIHVASSVRTGKLLSKEVRLVFKTTAYGIFNSEEYEMGKEITKKVLQVLRDYLAELKEELRQL